MMEAEVRQTFEGSMLHTLRMEKGATSQEMQQPLEARKGKKTYSPQSLQKEHSPVNTLILVQQIYFRLLTSKTI